MTAPRVFCSVVVPTRDRPDALRACLEGLARLEYPRDRMEVIVVDDGGRIDLESVVTPVRGALDVTLLHQPWAGPAAARNRGAEVAEVTSWPSRTTTAPPARIGSRAWPTDAPRSRAVRAAG